LVKQCFAILAVCVLAGCLWGDSADDRQEILRIASVRMTVSTVTTSSVPSTTTTLIMDPAMRAGGYYLTTTSSMTTTSTSTTSSTTTTSTSTTIDGFSRLFERSIKSGPDYSVDEADVVNVNIPTSTTTLMEGITPAYDNRYPSHYAPEDIRAKIMGD
jgi:hypothetical protein